MTEKVKYILGHVGIIMLLIFVIAGVCWIVNYEGDRIEAAKQDEAALQAYRAHEDSVQNAFENRLHSEFTLKAESLSVAFYTEWAKVKDTKEFKGCDYVNGAWDKVGDSYTEGKFAAVLLCKPHRSQVPTKIGNFTIEAVKPFNASDLMLMYTHYFRAIESAVYSSEGKVSEDEAKKVINAVAKGMGLIQ